MNALQVVEHRGGSPPLSLELPPETTFEQWVIIGRQLCLGSQALNWHIGDWWAFGDHRYGDRAKAAAEGIFGLEFQSLADMGWVSRAFPKASERSEVVPWSCYRVVASLAEDQKDAALSLIEKVERQSLSVRDLRREVQALRGSDASDHVDEPASPANDAKPATSQTELLRAYEALMDALEALEDYRPLTRGEQRMFEIANSFVSEAYSHRKHRVPADFDVIFVEQGRDACESWYRASKKTVTRWLRERGKKRLTELRADFISHQRAAGKWLTRTTDMVEHRQIDDAGVEQPDYTGDELYPIAREAANFLRTSRYGGWKVSPAAPGEWFVGTVRKSSVELIAMAERQGFDRDAVALQNNAGEAVERSS